MSQFKTVDECVNWAQTRFPEATGIRLTMECKDAINFVKEAKNEYGTEGFSEIEPRLRVCVNFLERTGKTENLISKCKEVGDYTTENFLQWFVTEQREEENKQKCSRFKPDGSQ